ncbi:MAG: glycosyltransferase family 2 protein [Leptolyngbya sp. SIO1D8]|nr:glycosyltransferase family 2 protein [Leptolyngbya sp. SIO1D8]
MLRKFKKLWAILEAEGFDGVIQRFQSKFFSISYAQWLQQTEQSVTESAISDGPLISILVPIYNVDQTWLIQAIESVLRQTYSHWQLCLADDASTANHIRPILDRYANQDSRIQVVFCSQNGGISAATNAALALATGEFIALLDHDDELALNALHEVAKHLQKHPETDFIYTDEDHITPQGQRHRPFFKPDWSPDYFHACMYTCHLGVYRTSLVQQIGGFRSEYDGAQDWDLVLRITEQTKKIHHIPKVLYHWRTLQTSAASGEQAKPWAYQAAQRALQDMVDRSQYPGWVESYPERPGFFRVRRHIQHKPLVSIVIPSAGTELKIGTQQVCLLEQCLQSIRHSSTYQNFEIILVDGYDIPEAILESIQAPDLKLVRCDQPFNFSQRMNLGAKAAKGEMLLMLNDDMKVVTPDWIESMLELAQQKEIAAVGAKLLFPNGRLQHAGVVILAGNPSHAFYNGAGQFAGYYCSNIVTRNYLGVTGACLMMRKSVFEELGGFDESFPLNYNDVVLCLQAHQAGYRNVFTPFAELIHYESVSRETKLKPGELERLHSYFEDTDYMLNDPYYNPNLSMLRPHFQLAWPAKTLEQKS